MHKDEFKSLNCFTYFQDIVHICVCALNGIMTFNIGHLKTKERLKEKKIGEFMGSVIIKKMEKFKYDVHNGGRG